MYKDVKIFLQESYLGIRPVRGELGGVPDQQRGEVDEVVLAADTLTINNCDIALELELGTCFAGSMSRLLDTT